MDVIKEKEENKKEISEQRRGRSGWDSLSERPSGIITVHLPQPVNVIAFLYPNS